MRFINPKHITGRAPHCRNSKPCLTEEHINVLPCNDTRKKEKRDPTWFTLPKIKMDPDNRGGSFRLLSKNGRLSGQAWPKGPHEYGRVLTSLLTPWSGKLSGNLWFFYIYIFVFNIDWYWLFGLKTHNLHSLSGRTQLAIHDPRLECSCLPTTFQDSKTIEATLWNLFNIAI